MARGAVQFQKGQGPSVRKLLPNWAFTVERVTGIEPALSAWESVRYRPLMPSDLQDGLSVNVRERPLVTGVNGTLMARRTVVRRSPPRPRMLCTRLGLGYRRAAHHAPAPRSR